MKLIALLVLVAACSERDQPLPRRDSERQRRVIEPPARTVRALPPHAIRADGIGPYKLGAAVTELLDQLPSGPRIARFTIPGIVHRDILRAEDDAIVIGAEPLGKATFVGAVRGEIAKTEAGIHVGSTRAELVRAHGEPIDDPYRARDPRLVVVSGLRNARFVLEGERVVALIVKQDASVAKDGEAPEAACARPAADRARRIFGACLTGAGELVRYGDDELSVLAHAGEKPIATARVPGLVFAVALRSPADGRDEVVALSRDDDEQERSWSLAVFRLVDGKLARVIEPTRLYQLTASNARWIGAELGDLELYIELAARADAIEVGGLLTTRAAGQIRDIVVISPAPVARRRAKPAPPDAGDAGTAEAASPAAPATTSTTDRVSR